MTEQFSLDSNLEPSARLAEAAVYSGLSKLFEINDASSIEVAERILRQISGYVADMALLDGSPELHAAAAGSLRRIQSDIASLIAHLEAGASAE